jgi:hypothetical protein
MCLHCAAATFAAIADGIEPIEHRIFEEGVVNVAAPVFGIHDLNGLGWCYPATAAWIMFGGKACERLSDDQANVHRLARICARCAAWAFEHNNVIRIPQYDVPCARIRDDLFRF